MLSCARACLWISQGCDTQRRRSESTVSTPLNAPTLPAELPRISYVQPGEPWLTSRLTLMLEILIGRRKVEKVYHQPKREAVRLLKSGGTLLHEASNRIGNSYDVEIGAPIPFPEFERLEREELTRHLHEVTWSPGAPG